MATTKPPKNHKYKYQVLIMEGDVKLITHVRYYSILRFHLPVKKQNNPNSHGNGGEQVASLHAGPQRVTKHINHRAYLNMSLSKVPLLVGGSLMDMAPKSPHHKISLDQFMFLYGKIKWKDITLIH